MAVRQMLLQWRLVPAQGLRGMTTFLGGTWEHVTRKWHLGWVFMTGEEFVS